MTRPPGPPRDQVKRQAILRLIERGWTTREIVHELKTSRALVRVLAREGPGLRLAAGPKGRPPNLGLQAKILEALRSGKTCLQVSREVGVHRTTVRKLVNKSGGMLPPIVERSDRRLSLANREEISRRLAAGWSFQRIARHISRPCSTVSREVNVNGGRNNYRAWSAERRYHYVTRRPKPAKLVINDELRAEVQRRLEELHSPRQIALCLMAEFPDQPHMHISHETIYQSLFIQGRGALRRELTNCLRTGRTIRKPQKREVRVGKIKGMIMISERPGEVEDRAVPGHWEGDLIIGKNGTSAIGTLVERQTRYVMLMKLKDKKAETVRDALCEIVRRLPQELFKTLTWDQGKEMAEHAQFSIDTGVEVFFCEPHKPWQRGSNENTNGLLRQYFPKGSALSGHSQEHLDAVARQLNNRPRETLNLKTPAQMLDQLLR